MKAKGCDSATVLSALDEYIKANPTSDAAYTQRGLTFWSMGKRAEAINDYLEALRINPQSDARIALQSTNNILDYYNKDLYNP